MFMIQAILQKTVEVHRGQATKMKHLAASGRRRLHLWWPNISLLLSIEQVIGTCFLIYTCRHCLLCSTHFCWVLCCGFHLFHLGHPAQREYSDLHSPSSQGSRRTLPYVFCIILEVTTYQVITGKEHHEHHLVQQHPPVVGRRSR